GLGPVVRVDLVQEEWRPVDLEAGHASQIPHLLRAERVLVPGDRGVGVGNDQHHGDRGHGDCRMPGPEVPPQSSGARSAIDSENVQRCPPRSSAVYWRSPYWKSVGSRMIVAPRARARSWWALASATRTSRETCAGNTLD